MEFNESEFLIETIVPQEGLIVSRTDLQGIITHANETFCEISGYTEKELIGKSHNILRHPDMPKIIFTELWDRLKHDIPWSGAVKNLRKDKGFYWVWAEVSAIKKDGETVGYKSIRTHLSFEDKLNYQKKYDLLKIETHDKIRKISYI